ncbi:MAG: hypothetical protein JOY60_09700 [Burkholderiaceae bacterium]|nr:hypothetical protein [Roseateles sp.]MBV8470117.1 hypothetical protein [Burkholderiaceae bacterium]
MRYLAAAVVISATAMGLVSNAWAQSKEPPPQQSQEEIQKSMTAAMGAMVPMMEQMTLATVEAQLKIAERPETAARIAAFKKNLFNALVKQGFTHEQALQITLATAPPSVTPMGK